MTVEYTQTSGNTKTPILTHCPWCDTEIHSKGGNRVEHIMECKKADIARD